MLADYRQRFPSTPVAPVVLATPVNLPRPPSPRASLSPRQDTDPAPQHDTDTSSHDDDDGREEGESPDNTSIDPWEDYVIPMPSPPAHRPSDSPPEDIGGFHNIMQRAANRFELTVTVEQSDCFLHDFKEGYRRVTRAIPIIEYIWKEGLNIMKTPASIPAVLPRIEKKYRAPSDTPSCLIGHPRPDSVISQAAQQKSKNPSVPISTPPDKEGRRLDAIGKKFSANAAASIKAANSLAILARYDRQMWSDLSEYLDLFPEDHQQEVRRIVLEGERAASEIIDCALDISNTNFRQLSGAAVLRRQGWLRATTFRPEVQTKILDMAYDGDSLFGKHIDDALLAIKTDTETAKSLGTLQYKRGSFRGARGRGYSSRGNYSNQQNRQYQSQYKQPYYQTSYRQPASGSFSRQGGKRRENTVGSVQGCFTPEAQCHFTIYPLYEYAL
ncbi:uncharacterized protein LOC144792043 [Lissotriton helveticus]